MSDHGMVAPHESLLDRAELEHPHLAGRTQWVGSRVLGACVGFYFLGFAFAYVYLKTLNINNHWQHGHRVDPSTIVGLIEMLLVLAAAAACLVAVASLRREEWQRWHSMIGLSALGLLAAAAVTLIQIVNPGFPYAASAYATVFVGWSWSLVVIYLVMTYYLATLFAQSQRVPPRTTTDADDLTSPPAVITAAEAVQIVLLVVAVIEVIAWVLLYLVR